MMTASTDNPYLLRDEFIDSRNTQDDQLNAELASIRIFVQACFDATEKRLIRRIDDLDAKHEQKMAYIRNQNLRNPNLPIEPIVSLRDEGLVLPSPTRFPKHAKQFYALRKPDTLLRVRMLSYLIDFYDIQWQRWEVSGGDDDADDYETYTDENEGEGAATTTKPLKLSLWDAVQTYPGLAVDALETILGLNEQNFINFRECARLKSPSQTIKRRQLLAPDRVDEVGLLVPGKRLERKHVVEAVPLPLTERLTWEELMEPKQPEKDESMSTRVGWDCAAPVMAADRMFNIAERGAHSSKGSLTNADTLSREEKRSRHRTPSDPLDRRSAFARQG
ncbi:hypothetical protein CSUB01_11127 [Colletotrichum sublineola]|uniref:WAC domain-containing protein n=1 Tax=Colletotrichum sublineola TaxID=1173701 RepID=A0A066XAU7_COLSU|nr:hypothetical protein CSUB01_11127 [Colletotrichum sublineola]